MVQAQRAALLSQEGQESDQQTPVKYLIPKCEKCSCAAQQLAVQQKNHPMLRVPLLQLSLPVWPHLQLSQSSERKVLHLSVLTPTAQLRGHSQHKQGTK